jgi:hypothetical protein
MNTVVTVQEHVIVYCRCRGALKLFRFMLPPYSSIGTCNNVQNSTFRPPAEICKFIYINLGARGFPTFENRYPAHKAYPRDHVSNPEAHSFLNI